MPDCTLRPATADDAQIVYALICELKQAEFDHQAFHAGYLANLQDHNMRYQLAELNGQVVGMIGLHMQFHLHHARWMPVPVNVMVRLIVHLYNGLVKRKWLCVYPSRT